MRNSAGAHRSRGVSGEIVEILLRHAATLPALIPSLAHPDAERLVRDDPFALLVGVICDQGIPAERAWMTPFLLRERLGHLDPVRLDADRGTVLEAFAAPPMLHRFYSTVGVWVAGAARRTVTQFGGDAAQIWADRPRAVELQRRLREFDGIGQKKAALMVEILVRDLGVGVSAMSGSDVAYDVHLRRVFLRTGLAARDDQDHMVEVARSLHPSRPGELDLPAWDVGRKWCHARAPVCQSCPLGGVCAMNNLPT